MTPQPLEQGGAVTAFIPTGQEMAPRQNLIPLGRLIDFIIQRTYHELTVLAELLPRKTDMERKIEIYNFSASTRQLFIRLLALVKWANSASKVDKSAKIMAFLDKQSLLFIDTADMLSRMARETLVNARLPNFHIPAAVEILTTGTYSRLPSIIRERIVPPDPITPAEKRQTLQRLNQVIQHRLVTGNLLPQLRKFKIENGRVTFKVDHEFEVSLTVMGDGPNIPWRLLDIDILVEDKETGDGKALVHTLQVNYIHQLIQGRIVDSPDALAEVYNCLHYFSQSLQMEVLYTQTLRLMRDRLDDHIHVDEYIPGTKLTVSYWRELTNKDPKSELGYRLMIQTDQNDSAKQLAILHIPSIGNKEVDIADRAVRSDLLSMERLLVHTVYVRSLARLADLKSELQLFLQDVDYSISGTPAMLTVPILNPCLRAEQIYITVDTHTGMLRCHVPKHLDCPIMPEMQHALNNDRSKLQHLFSELRYWITQRRCEKTLQHLPATTQERLPLVFPPDHAIEKIGPHRVYIQLYRHSNVILIVELKEKDSSPNEMTYTFYLVLVKPSSVEDSQSQDASEPHATSSSSSVSQSGPGSVPPGGPPSVPGMSSSSTQPTTSSGTAATENDGMPKMYLKVQSLIEFDTFVATHGPGTYVDELAGSKRKLSGLGEGPSKQPKVIYPAYFIPELAHVVAMCDEKLPFVALAKELTRRRIPHGGLQVEANATSLVLKLLTLPQPKAPLVPVPAAAAGQQGGQDQKQPEPKVVSVPRIEKDVWNALLRRLLSVSVRAQVNKGNQTRLWTTELVFYGSPLTSAHHKEQGMRRAVYLQYDMSPVDAVDRIVDMILNDWSKIVYLYTLVHDFREQIDKYNLQNIVTIKSYSYTSLLLAYGPNKEVNVNIYWDIEAKEFKMVFTGGNNAINAHSMMRDQLQAHLNHNYDLAQIVHLLHETYQPLSSIAKLPIIPHLAIFQSPKIPVLSFCIIPQSPTLLRISFQGVYCLEIRLRGSGLCSIRDGAYSRFDRSHVVEEFTPTQGLKGFLSKYVDETAVYRRRSQSEDDNPPSPITMEDPHGGPASVGSTFLGGGSMRGPQSPRDPGLRFAAPLTPPSGSNPHTPASPHPQGMSGGSSQNHPNFNMTSPPAPHMPHPSPSGGLMPSSPLNPQPSPMAHSPGPSNMPYMGGQTHTTDGSPFTAAHSPAASNWPGSPGMPRPSPRPGQSPDHKAQTPHHNTSRVLPARSWAGAIPTLLTHEALDTLCRATAHPQKEIPGPELSPLERFLGSVFMRRQFQRIIHQEENQLTAITSNEPGVVLFKADNLQYQVFLNPNHMQSLHMKVSQTPQMAPMMDGKPPYQWSPEDLQILEQFFDQRVAAPPYRPAVVTSFTRMLNLSAQVMKDMIQIMRLDLMPELGQGNKWNVQFILRMPPSATPIVPVGTTTILSHRQKILFFIQITRVPYLPNMEWKDCVTMLLPMVYDMTVNHTQLAERREQNVPQLTSAVSAHLRRFAECTALPPGECSLFPAVRDLLMNLTLPNEQPAPGQMPNQIGPMGAMPPGGQIAPSPVGSSPNPMMHSPMQMGGAPGGQQQYGAGGGMAGAGPGQGGPGQGAGGPN